MRPPAAPKLTYDDFLCFPDDGRRHELVDGEHVVTPSPGTVHQRLVGRLFAALHAHLEATRGGEVFVAPFDVVLSDHDVVEPDLVVILAGQWQILTDRHVRGAPALVVEVLSPGTRQRDETLKRRLYVQAGVGEYWMVDPDHQGVKLCRHATAGDFAAVSEYSAESGDVLTSPLLPGFSLALRRLFARPER